MLRWLFPTESLRWLFPIIYLQYSLYTHLLTQSMEQKLFLFYRNQLLVPDNSVYNCCLYSIVPEQKARVTYDNMLRLSDDPDVNDVIIFLREREVVHFQRFGEAIELLRRKLNQRNVYCMNPAIDL